MFWCILFLSMRYLDKDLAHVCVFSIEQDVVNLTAEKLGSRGKQWALPCLKITDQNKKG